MEIEIGHPPCIPAIKESILILMYSLQYMQYCFPGNLMIFFEVWYTVLKKVKVLT